MFTNVPSVGSSHSDISAVKTILEHAENVCKKSHSFASEWPNELCCAQKKIFHDVHNEIQNAICFLLHWETDFRTEISEIYAKYWNAVREQLTEMCSLEDMLMKRIAAIRLLLTSLEDKDLLLQEANKLLEMIAVIEERMRYSVFPRVAFNAVAPFSEENRHKFWYLATLDILPHQLILHCSPEINLGTAVFSIDVPHTKCVAQLPKLLKCTLELEATKVLQELKPQCNDGHIDIEVNITNPCHHTINVQLYEQHICGSPLTFLPLLKTDPVAIEQYKAVEQCCSYVKAQETFVTLDKDTSLSSSDDDDPMMDSQEYQCRRQRLSMTGIARVNSFLGEATLDRANETTALKDLKSQEDAKSVKMLPKKSLVPKKKVLESETCRCKGRKTDLHVNKKIEKKSSVFEKAIAEIKNIAVKNVGVTRRERGQLDNTRWRSSLSENVVDDLKKSAANGDESFKINEMAVDGNVADNVEDHEAYQSNPSQNGEPCGQTIKMGQTTTAQIIGEVELLRRMALDDSLNHAGDKPENSEVFTPRAAPRKQMGLIQPLRRPRVPSLLSDVTSVYFQKCEAVKKSEGDKDVDNTEKAQLLKLEAHGTTVQGNSNYRPGTSISDVDIKPFPKIPQKIAQPTELIKKQPEICKALVSTDVCIKREDDVKTTGLGENDNFAMSGAKEIAFDGAASYQEDALSRGTEGKKPTSLVTKAGKYRNDSPAKLSGKITMKLYGPSDDPLFQPIGIAELNDKRVVVADTFNNRMALFSSKGIFLRYLSTEYLRCPSAVVVLRDGNFAVKENRGIVIFRENGDFMKALSADLKRPYGLTVLEDGNLMTVETTGKGYMTLVTVNPVSGSEISRVRVDLGLPPNYHRISKPRFISYHRHGRILVVDLGLNCIFVVDITHGTVLSVFGEEGSYEGQFRDPSGITCDRDGYIVVGDSRNHRVQVFDPYGHFLCILATDIPLSRPSGICLTSAGELLVSNYWDQSVARYTLTN